eukprot:8483150-Alexandrium_andersonii.AAC.1
MPGSTATCSLAQPPNSGFSCLGPNSGTSAAPSSDASTRGWGGAQHSPPQRSRGAYLLQRRPPGPESRTP